MRVYRSHDGKKWDISGPEWMTCCDCEFTALVMVRRLSTGRVQYSPALDKQIRSHRNNCPGRGNHD